MRHSFLRIETTTGRLPAKVDVAIVGGGAAGIATAYALTKKGLSVAVFEKGLVAAEQSSRNWGWCRTLGRDAREFPMAKLSVDIWRNMTADTGVDVGFQQTGVTFVTDDPKEMATWEKWLDSTKRFGVPTRMLTATEANASHAWAEKPWIGGIRSETDGYAEPSRAFPALARHLMSLGVKIYQQCAVNKLLLDGQKVRGIRTEHGDVQAENVVMAGGAWSSLFLRKHGLSLPTMRVHASASAIDGFDTGGPCPVRAPEFSMRPRNDGRVVFAQSGRGAIKLVPDMIRHGAKFLPMYRAKKARVSISLDSEFFRQAWTELSYLYFGKSPFQACRILDPEPDLDLIQRGYAEASKVLPQLKNSKPAMAWSGVIDNTPDGIPVISAVEDKPGLFLCTGFSGHGFSSSMGAGHALAETIVSGKSSVDLTPFHYGRFTQKGLEPSIIY